jgi:hypothetical protein
MVSFKNGHVEELGVVMMVRRLTGTTTPVARRRSFPRSGTDRERLVAPSSMGSSTCDERNY